MVLMTLDNNAQVVLLLSSDEGGQKFLQCTQNSCETKIKTKSISFAHTNFGNLELRIKGWRNVDMNWSVREHYTTLYYTLLYCILEVQHYQFRQELYTLDTFFVRLCLCVWEFWFCLNSQDSSHLLLLPHLLLIFSAPCPNILIISSSSSSYSSPPHLHLISSTYPSNLLLISISFPHFLFISSSSISCLFNISSQFTPHLLNIHYLQNYNNYKTQETWV